jgi:hypothetical protein
MAATLPVRRFDIPALSNDFSFSVNTPQGNSCTAR